MSTKKLDGLEHQNWVATEDSETNHQAIGDEGGEEAPSPAAETESESEERAAVPAQRILTFAALREQFDSAAHRREQADAFQLVRAGSPALAGFEFVDDLVALVQKKDENYDQKDAILLALIVAYKEARARGLASLLLRAMLPALDVEYKSRAYRMDEAIERSELGSRVFVAFMETLARYPANSWMRAVAKCLAKNTVTRLRATEKSDERQQIANEKLTIEGDSLVAEQERTSDEEQRGVFDLVSAPESEPAPPHPDEVSDVKKRIARYVEAGRLHTDDAALLLEVTALGRPVVEVAAELGIDSETAYKRVERALSRLRTGAVIQRQRKRRS